MWVNRCLLLFCTFLAQFQSNSVYIFSVQCSWTGVISSKSPCIKIYFTYGHKQQSVFLAQLQCNSPHDVSIQCLVYLSLDALFFSQYGTHFISFIDKCIPWGRTQFFLHISDVSTNCVWHCSKKKEKSVHCINLHCNNDFLGNELIAIADKARKNRTSSHCVNSFMCAFHPTYTDSMY
jgi:hypothetical protein